MKKRIIATLLVGAVAASTVVGFSACGSSVSVPKGEEVNEEKWIAAFEKTFDDEKLINYTASYSTKSEVSVKGNISTYDSSKDKTTPKDLDSTEKYSSTATILYDVKGNKAYSEGSSTASEKSKYDGDEKKESSKSTNKEYYELSTDKDGRKMYWNASYSSSSSETLEEKISREYYWDASETDDFASASIKYLLGGSFYDSDDKEKAEESSIVELYEKFTYSGGVYKATLYSEVSLWYDYDSHKSIYELVETTVTVSIKDGYVVGYGTKINAKGNSSQSVNKDKNVYNGWDLEYTYKYEIACALTNIDNTDTSKKVNKDITKAIDKAKAEKAKKEENK